MSVLADTQDPDVVGSDLSGASCDTAVFDGQVAILVPFVVDVMTAEVGSGGSRAVHRVSAVHEDPEPALIREVVERLVLCGFQDRCDGRDGSVALLVVVYDDSDGVFRLCCIGRCRKCQVDAVVQLAQVYFASDPSGFSSVLCDVHDTTDGDSTCHGA